jgi:energy-coupling factor transport system permease protein
MNNFEYLRLVNLGQYIPTGSWIHRLDPRARILATILLLAAVTFAPSPAGLVLALGIVLLLLVLARIPLAFALRGLLPPLPFLLILAVLQVLFPVRADPSTVLVDFGWIQITTAGIRAGIMLLLRFSALILTLGLGSYVISTAEFIRGLESLLTPLNRLRIPTADFVMMIQVMLRFIPFLAMGAERIAKAQASRGADWGTRRGGPLQRVRQAFPLLVPLFLTGLRRAESLALAMESRGYANRSRHTSMIELEFRLKDALAIAAAGVIAAAIVFL